MKITVRLHPNAKTQKINKNSRGVFHVYVVAQPIKGKANQEAIEMLAQYFEVSKSHVFLDSGVKSKNKVFQIIKN